MHEATSPCMDVIQPLKAVRVNPFESFMMFSADILSYVLQ